jgi:hypothetical protein
MSVVIFIFGGADQTVVARLAAVNRPRNRWDKDFLVIVFLSPFGIRIAFHSPGAAAFSGIGRGQAQ